MRREAQTRRHTDLATGDFARVVVWKLKGPLRSSPDPLFGLPALSIDMELYTEFVLAGLSGLAGDAVTDPSAPYLPTGKFSSIGDSVLGSKDVLIGEVITPSKPSPPN